MLPGALIVTGTSELAAGHMQAGTSRLACGTVQLAFFAAGPIAATVALGVPAERMANVRVDELGPWAAPAGLLLLAFGAQWGGHALGSAAAGGFPGAIAFGLLVGSSLGLAPRERRGGAPLP